MGAAGVRRQSLCLRLSLMAAFALLMAGCQPVAVLPDLPFLTPSAEPLPVLEGAVRVVGPSGYCPDTASLRESGGAAVVLLGRCAAESEATPAVLSVAIGAAGSGAAMSGGGSGMAAFLTSDQGRASLSRSGRASDLRIRKALSDDRVFLVLLEDRQAGTYWRGMIPVAGHLVSISAIGPGLEPEAGRKLVQDGARALWRANAPR